MKQNLVERTDKYVIYLGHEIMLGKQNQITKITRQIRDGWVAFGR